MISRGAALSGPNLSPNEPTNVPDRLPRRDKRYIGGRQTLTAQRGGVANRELEKDLPSLALLPTASAKQRFMKMPGTFLSDRAGIQIAAFQ